MGADAPPLGRKGIGYRAFGRYGVATVVMQILLMVGGFDVDGGAELILVDVNIKGDMGLGGVLGEVDRVATVEPFKEGDEGVWTMWPEAGFIELRVKEFLLKVAQEQIGIGGGHTSAHDRAFDLEVMMGVGDVVVGEDKLGEFDKELSGWYGMGRTLIKEKF